MASKAVSKAIKVDWSRFNPKGIKLSESDVKKMNKLKSQIDSTAVKASSLPDSLPKIDWAFYKANASDPKMVEELEKKYGSFKIEPPKAPVARLEEIKRAKQQDLNRYDRFAKYATNYIESAEIVKKKFEKMIPVEDMSHEDWALTFPLWSITPENPLLDMSDEYGRTPGLTREEQIAFEQPDPVSYSSKRAWQDWEKRKAKFYSEDRQV